MGIAMILRLGGTLEMIDKQFNSISTCASFTRTRERGLPISRGNCCGNAIMNVIKDFLKGKKPVKIEEKSTKLEKTVEKVVKTTPDNQISKPQCPECKAEINMVEGCMTCPHCGYSKCS